MPPYLPGEITDHIIGSVSVWEKSTLCNCSLVCHAWLPASRRRLFSIITIQDPATYELLVDRVLRSEEMRPYLAATREIRLHTTPTPTKDWTQAAQHRWSGTPFLCTFYGCLPCLENLSLQLVCFWGRSVDPLLLFSPLSKLRHLRLDGCMFPSPKALCRTITALQALEELRISAWERPTQRWVSEPRYNGAPGPRLHVLRCYNSLHLPEDLLDVFFHWLSKSSSPATLLKELDIRIGLDSTHLASFPLRFGPGYLAFFKSVVASSVSSLCLTIMEGRHSPLSYFAKLSSLTLRSPFRHIPDPSMMLWAKVCSMLNDLRSPIRYLKLVDVLYHEPEWGPTHSDPCYCLEPGSGVAELDVTLSRDVFDNLVQVGFDLRRFTYTGPSLSTPCPLRPPLDDNEVLNKMTESLPQLCARGIVTFEEHWSLWPLLATVNACGRRGWTAV